jgi:hypothetical protein
VSIVPLEAGGGVKHFMPPAVELLSEFGAALLSTSTDPDSLGSSENSFQ